MPQSISKEQLIAYQKQIEIGGVEAVRQVYQTLYDKGYNYAGWALGVATGETITGQSALQFLQSTALMGLDSQTCKNLSATQIDQIRVKMADATLQKMIDVANNEGGGYLKRELNYAETKDFHTKAFEASGLNINNWTLQAPMDLLGKVYGQAYVEQVWQEIRATGGDGIDAVFMSGALAAAVGQVYLISKDSALRTEAQAWLNQLPSVVTTVAGKLLGALSAFVPQDALIAARTLGLMVSEPVGLNLGELAGGKSTTRLNDIWVATDLGNGSRLLKVSPSDPSTVVVLSSGVYQKLEIPDGKGGYLQIAMGDKTTDVTSWAGVPGQSAQLKRVLTTQTDAGQNSKTYQGTALVKESTTSEQTINGQASQVIDTIYYDKGQVTSRETVTQLGSTVMTQSYGPKGQLLYRTEVQTYDDGSRFEYKTEGGKNYIQAIDEDGKASGWKEYKTPAQEQATNAMYSDMAGFVNALRGKDKVNQLLYAAKIGINYQISQGNTNPSLQSLNNDVAALGAVVGVVAGLRAMRSGDTKTQIGGAVGLVSSANMLYAYANTGTVAAGGGFLTLEQAGALQLVGAAISISNLKHLDEMIDNGQYGSAMATLYGAYVGVTAIGSLAAGATLSSLVTSAAAAGPAGLIVAMGAIALDSMFAEDPPPPPPFGDATFRRNAKGQLVWDYGSQSNNLGRSVLAPHMQAMAAKLKTYVDESNKGVTDTDRQFVLLASRLPKVYIQSWPSYTDNGKTNFFFALEYKHPQTREKIYATVARDDLDSDYAAYTVMPEALVQRWQVATMSGRFGADESQWLTEGQWANANSALEQQRVKLSAAVQAAQTALNDAKQSHLKLVGTQVVTDGVVGAGVAQAEQKLKSALAALQVFAAEHPQNGDTAARIVDSTLVANMQILKASDPEEYLKAYNLARDKTSQQWMKVIALDWDGDGKVAHLAALQNAGTDLKSLQSDGATRFDVDGDGYREVTEWINPGDAMLGIDLDGDGVIGNSREMFNGAATAFDQRGWGSLKYYDSNKDNKIDRSDAVFKLLRLWVDINGDGTAGTMETLTLDMDYVGVDMAKLKASLDAAGQQALAALQQLKVQSIDLSTMKFKLGDGLVKDCRSRCRVRALFVKGHNTRWQKNANTSTARLLGCAI